MKKVKPPTLSVIFEQSKIIKIFLKLSNMAILVFSAAVN